MIYKNLSFPIYKHRPFFYTCFVTTIDGKAHIQKNGYWPLGSKTDYETFTYLRAHADAIIQGKNTALQFGQKTIDTIHKKSFQALRKSIDKKNPLEYIILSSTPKKMKKSFTDSYNYRPILLTSTNPKQLSKYLHNKGYQHVYVDGGPRLLQSFLAENLLDEVFLTIAPKIVGNEQNQTSTMVEGGLFSPKEIKTFTLISVKAVKNEVFLRYASQQAKAL